MPISIAVPANTQPEVREAFQQVERHLRELEIPILRDMREVRGIPEGSSCYYVTARSNAVQKFTKINNRLYYETLNRY